MAMLDENRDVLVVRIVYDGPPFSGKTTTLRSLSEGLAGDVETPGEHDGRTLYFDWLDYTAGRFEGRPIRCQIVTVPGQKSLVERRRKLLELADAVVFVADTGRLGVELSLKYAREASGFLSRLDEPRPGIVIQANKRDVDDALAMPDVVEQFRQIGIEAAFIETTATSGSGIREAFLFGVRLALDRVRELSHRGLLRAGRPDINTSRELLENLVPEEAAAQAASTVADAAGDPEPAVEGPSPAADGPVAAGGGKNAVPNDAAVPESTAGKVIAEAIDLETSDRRKATSPTGAGDSRVLPDPTVPSGFIWPPVEGRVILQQAVADKSAELEVLSSGDLHAYSVNGWRFHSRLTDVFEEQNDGRSALVEWARIHARNAGIVSSRRCVVLSPSEKGWRLWQIIGKFRSLHEFLCVDVQDMSPRRWAESILVAGRKLLQAQDAFAAATVALPVGLMTVAADTPAACFIGTIPGFDSAETGSGGGPGVPPTSFLATRLAKPLGKMLTPELAAEIREEFDRIGLQLPDERHVTSALAEMLAKERAA